MKTTEQYELWEGRNKNSLISIPTITRQKAQVVVIALLSSQQQLIPALFQNYLFLNIK